MAEATAEGTSTGAGGVRTAQPGQPNALTSASTTMIAAAHTTARALRAVPDVCGAGCCAVRAVVFAVARAPVRRAGVPEVFAIAIILAQPPDASCA